MKILIAESKTMKPCDISIGISEYEAHKPFFEEKADEIIMRLGNYSVPELARVIGISIPLATKLKTLIYEFPNKALGMLSVEAFTGVVFRALDYESLNQSARLFVDNHVNIISSLYGILSPLDIVKAYRLDFKVKAGVEQQPLCHFWKLPVTIRLVKDLKESGEREVLNLLPSDAGNCVDWKVLRRFAKDWRVEFKETGAGGVTRTPNAGRLKTMRGLLLREIAEFNIENPSDIKDINSENYIFDGFGGFDGRTIRLLV